jgi:hypothetical protein
MFLRTSFGTPTHHFHFFISAWRFSFALISYNLISRRIYEGHGMAWHDLEKRAIIRWTISRWNGMQCKRSEMKS